MNKIIIIGTEPPCPRCGLITQIMKEKVKELNINAEIEHLPYTDEKARKLAKSYGMQPGTAKDVAKLINSEIDKVKLSQIMQGQSSNKINEYSDYNNCNWSYELDEFLRPYELKASEVEILMTPVLIINGELMHSGSVPEMNKINSWLLKLKG